MENRLTQLAARGASITLVAQMMRVGIFVLQVVLLAHLIEPGEFGLIAMVLAMTGVAVIIRDFGLSISALRSVNLNQQQRTNLFWINSGIGLILGIVIYLLAFPVASFYAEPRLVLIVQWMAPTYLLSGVAAQFRVIINQELRYTALAICDVIPPLVALLVAIPIAMNEMGITALIALQLIAPIVDLLLAIGLAGWRPGLPRRTVGMRNLVSFGLGFAASQLIGYIARNIDSIALGKVWGPVSLGYFDRAVQLSAAPISQINVPMTKVAVPVLSRVADDNDRFLRGVNSAQLVACYLTSTVLLVAAGLATPLIEVCLGRNWLPAASLFAILCVSSVFRSVQQIAVWMQIAKGTARSLFFSYLFGQPIIIVAILCGLPWGALGVAIGGTLGYVGFWIFSMFWAGKDTEVNVLPLIRRAVRVISCVGFPAGVSSYLVATLVPASNIVLIILGVFTALISLCVSWLLSRKTKVEVLILWGFMRSGLARTK